MHAWECDFNNPNQLWDIHNVFTGAGYVKGGSSGQSGGSVTTIANSTQIFNNQYFALNTNIAFPRYPNPGSSSIKMGVWLSDAQDPHQRFRINRLSNGSFQIIHLHTSKCLSSVTDTSNKTDVIVRNCDSANIKQQWDILQNGSQVMFRRRGTNQCLDMPLRVLGTLTHMWSCSYTWTNPNQIFKIGTLDTQFVNTISSQLLLNGVSNLKSMANISGNLNQPYYQDFKNLLTTGLSFRDIITKGRILMPDGTFYKPTLEEYAFAAKNGYFANMGPNWSFVLENGKVISRVLNVAQWIPFVVEGTKDYQNIQASQNPSIVPFPNAIATFTGILAGNATTTFIIGTGCTTAVVATAGLGGIPCVIVAVSGGVVVGEIVETSTGFVFNEILTKQNVANVYRVSKRELEEGKNAYFPQNINELQFIRNLCLGLTGSPAACPVLP